MKIENNPDYNRAPVVVGLPENVMLATLKRSVRNIHGSELNITIGYVSDLNPPAHKAVLLDSVVIPEIIKRFNAHEELVAALGALLKDHRAMCSELAAVRGLRFKTPKETRTSVMHEHTQKILDQLK